MKVLLINGSPHEHGCTAAALDEMIRIFKEEGVETVLLQTGMKDIRGCIACNTCRKTGACVFKDTVNEAAALFEEADGLVIGSRCTTVHPTAICCPCWTGCSTVRTSPSR